MGKPFLAPTCEGDAARENNNPTAPSYEEVAKNDLSYVDFLLFGNKENYNVRADKASIMNSGTELARMVKADKYIIRDSNIDVNNFELMIRFLETKFIRFNNVKHTLEILELATTYQCQDLEIACVKEIDLNLCIDNVLDVFHALWFYNSKSSQPKEKSAKLLTSVEYLTALLNNTLQLIDMRAQDILVNLSMLTMRFEELEVIVKREALQITTETILFELLANWSLKECERKKLELTEENRRRMLGALIYTPRYLTMKPQEFRACRVHVDLLNSDENQLIEDFFNGKKISGINQEQNLMLDNFKKPRPQYAQMPIHLSDRSNPKNYPKKMRKAMMNDDDSEKKCCDSFFLNCASAFACIFE